VRKIFDYLKYGVLPWVKVKSRYFWWVIKYRGKKNIPPEVISEQINKSISRSAKSLEEALKGTPESLDEKKIERAGKTLEELSFLRKELENCQDKNIKK
jgi:hypothetical protein